MSYHFAHQQFASRSRKNESLSTIGWSRRNSNTAPPSPDTFPRSTSQGITAKLVPLPHTFELVGTLHIPIFQGGKVHSDVLKAEASLRQAQAQLADVKGQIDQDVRNALLDLKSSADQVEVAQSSVDLADQALIQSRDRFAAGITA
jgi:outer membrane protein TolC